MKKASKIKVTLVEAERSGPAPVENPCADEQSLIDEQAAQIAALEDKLNRLIAATRATFHDNGLITHATPNVHANEVVLAGEISRRLVAERHVLSLLQALAPFIHFHDWIAALIEIGDIDPLTEEDTITQVSGGGGHARLMWQHFTAARTASIEASMKTTSEGQETE